MDRSHEARLLAGMLLDAVGDAGRATLPARLIRWLGLEPRLLRLAPGGGSIISVPESGHGPLWCLLDPADVLSLDEPCPASNVMDIWRVVSLRLPELLPLRPDLLSIDIVPSKDGGRVHAVRKSVLDRATQTLASAGLRPARLGVEGEDGVDFLRLDAGRLLRACGRMALMTSFVWAGAAVAPLVLAGYLSWDTGKLEAMLVRDAEAVREAADMRDRIAFMAEQQRSGGLLLAQPPRGPLLDLIAELLPDDAVLTELSIGPDGIRLRGRAADAGALLARLRSNPVFADARFAMPITPTPDGKAEVFAIATGGTP